jgi:hypothetical protein
LTKNVRFSELLLVIEVGIGYESTQQDLLLMLITTSTIMPQISFAEYIAILLQVMDLLQTLLLLNMTIMNAHMLNGHLIPKYVSN